MVLLDKEVVMCNKNLRLKVIHFSTMMSNHSSTWKTTTEIKLDIT